MDPTFEGMLILLLVAVLTTAAIIAARRSDAAHDRKIAAMSPEERARYYNKRPTLSEVYLEEATLQAEAVRDAMLAARGRVTQMPDQESGLALLGAPVDEEAFRKKSILHERVKRRERWMLLAEALANSQRRW
jgi:hypothetical protein